MTDTFEVQGDFSPAESFDIAVAAEPVQQPEAPVIPNGFIKLGLAPELLRAVEDLGFTQPTAVQEKVLPLAMIPEEGTGGKFIDLLVSSQTGSGKTAAFLLPVLHTLLAQQAKAEADARAEYERAVAEAAEKGEAPPKRAKRKDPTNPRHFSAAVPGALILCPTRELAQQVAHDAIELVKHCRGLRIASVVGGMPYQLQIAKLQNANLVVATPGRLLDLQRSMQIKLDQVQFLVVDEADRMLDLGFADDLAEVNQLTAARKQTMMFSATFAPRIQQLATRVMREPQKITIDSPQEKHANIKQVLFWADNAQHKRKLLDHWLRDASIDQAIVFASTQIECDGLANDLQQDGFSAVALHGALSQGLRNRRLMALRQGQVQILVATDVAARGIDVPTITHVFNFGLPMKAEDYTHRIGRTGRAGRDGLAVTLAEFRDRRRIFDIEAFTRQQFKSEVIPGMEPQQRAPSARPAGNFGDRGGRDYSRDRKPGGNRGGFGGGFGRNEGFGGNGGGFGDRNARGPRIGGGSYHQGGANTGNGGGNFAPRDDRGGFDRRDGGQRANPFDRHQGQGRNEGFGAPRGDFQDRQPSFGKPSFAKPAGKVFVPRDAKKRPYNPAR
jgi:superfamily II DNA/RNA helicase